MEALLTEFGTVSMWAGIAVAYSWMPYKTVSQLADEWSIYKGQIIGSKEGRPRYWNISIRSH